MKILGGSPMPQPENLFTIAEYKELLQRLEEVRKQHRTINYKNPGDDQRDAFLWDQFYAIKGEYVARLPVYLLARCPICGGRVWEPIDTYSLNGWGWKSSATGFGWLGSRSYTAECKHMGIIAYNVNLNGLKPDDVHQEVWIGPEKPFVMKPLIAVDEVFVVIHALPVGRYDDPEPQPRYTVYFTTYFTGNKAAFQEVTRLFAQDRSLVQYSAADYNLLPWVEAGKLFWLDRENPELALRNRPIDMFPYEQVEGLEGLAMIWDGKLKLYIGPKGQTPRGEAKPKGGTMREILNSFLQRWRGEC